MSDERPLRAVEPHPDPPRRGRAPRHPQLRRQELYPRPVVDGREVPDTFPSRFRGWFRELLTSDDERQEAALGAQLAAAEVRRTNRIAVVSPKGGVGKTTTTFLLGNLLAAYPKLRTLAVDANRDFGTLAELAPDRMRAERNLADLIQNLRDVHSSTELSPYVSRMPTGLHLLAAPEHAEVMAEMTPSLYGQMLEFVASYYDVILLDLGTGIVDPLTQFALKRADHVIVVTTPEYVTGKKVLGALRHLVEAEDHPVPGFEDDGEGPQLTVVLNKAPTSRGGRRELEHKFRAAGVRRHIVIPEDEQLATMLDSGTYALPGLRKATRLPIKRLGALVTERLL